MLCGADVKGPVRKTMKVLFIGGTGIISSACSRLSVERGTDLYLLNRGTTLRPIPAGAKILKGDIRNETSAKQAIGDLKFDAVVDWVAFTPEHIEADLKLFRNRTGQFIFISSASAYQTPPVNLPSPNPRLSITRTGNIPGLRSPAKKGSCGHIVKKSFP
jgi:nucleoside-diphosphate-sugar epimerase